MYVTLENLPASQQWSFPVIMYFTCRKIWFHIHVTVKQYLACETGHMLGTHTFTVTIMHGGISECDGQQVTWCASAATLYFWNDKQQPVAISALSQHRCHVWANRNRSQLSSALGRHAALDERRPSTHWVLKVEDYLLCCSGIPLAGFKKKNLLHSRLIAVEAFT